jgi:purine-nucleoside phosphorylase
MSELLSRLEETRLFIQNAYPHRPRVGIILGSGLGNFTQQIKVEKEMDYASIPHFPVSTVEGHKGKLIFGELEGKKIVAMAGRFHFYEGYSTQEVTYPIRVLRSLGIECLFLSNAAGGVNEDFKVGDLMIINDHISFGIPNPLIGKNEDSLGPRFPDMTEPYKRTLIDRARAIAVEMGIDIKEGVYYVTTGPTFETRAEYRLIQRLGADAVGMSTVQENIVARHMGLPVFAVSVITDLGLDDHDKITHEEVLAAAKDAEPKLAGLFKGLIKSL